MSKPSFLEILEQEIRSEIYAELREQFPNTAQETERAAPRRNSPEGNGISQGSKTRSEAEFANWYLSNDFTTRNSNGYRGREDAYTKFSKSASKHSVKGENTSEQKNLFTEKKPCPEVNRRTSHQLSAEQQVALIFFSRHGSFLDNSFSSSELQKAYRRLALRFHPDRFASKPELERKKHHELFLQLKSSCELLHQVFTANDDI